SRAGTRSVATLSEAQLARKRANDREAQRSIRQRTKERIERLEQRIKELTEEQNDDRSFEEVQRRNEELEEELRALKENMPQQDDNTMLPNFSPSTCKIRRMSSIPSSRPTTPSMTSMPSPFLNQPPFSSSVSSNSPVGSGSQAMSPAMQLPIRNDISMSMQYMPAMTSVPLATSMPTMSSSFLNQPSRHSWELPLRFLPPTGPVDAILIGILQCQRSLALNGTAGESLTGPVQPSLQALIRPERSNETHPVASIISSLLHRTALRGLAEKVGALYVIYRLTQWQITPNIRTFNNLPEWHQPRSSQYITPHPIWVTQIIWGKLRDVVINNQEIYATDEFQHIYTANLNVNWPYRDIDVLNFEGNEVRLTTAFENHINNLANWSLDEPFERRYPELKGCFKATGKIDRIDHL
ncbi:hypothetical protein B0J14DRAFT_480362, partial [Halenospora varia]